MSHFNAMNINRSESLESKIDLKQVDIGLSQAREILSTEMTRIGEILAREGRAFFDLHQADLDRVLIIPKDYTLRHGAEFSVLLIQKGVAMNTELEDLVSEWDIALVHKYPSESFSTRTMVLPFCESDESYSSLAEVTAINTIKISRGSQI